MSVAKFPFRHLSLAGFVTGEICVLPSPIFPGESPGPFSLLSTLEEVAGTSQNLDSLDCNSLSARLGRVLLRLAGPHLALSSSASL